MPLHFKDNKEFLKWKPKNAPIESSKPLPKELPQKERKKRNHMGPYPICHKCNTKTSGDNPPQYDDKIIECEKCWWERVNANPRS